MVLELCLNFVQFDEHLLNLLDVVSVEESWIFRNFKQLVDLVIELGNHLVQTLLEAFFLLILLSFDGRDEVCQSANLGQSLLLKLCVLFPDVQLVIIQDVELLSEQVDSVSHILEPVVSVVVALRLLNELFDVIERALVQVPRLLHEPFSGNLVPLSDDSWYECLNLFDVRFWSWSDLAAGALGVKLDQSDIGRVWQLRGEEVIVVIEQLESVVKILDRVLQSLIDQYLEIDLSVSPVYFENRLEPPLEALHFVESTFEDVCYDFFVSNMKWMLSDPSIWIKSQFLWLLPRIANDGVPLLECVGIWE